MANPLEVRHQVAIAGRVIDVGAKKPLGNVLVSLVEMPAAMKSLLAARAMQYGSRWATTARRPDRTRTAPDGLFYFLDLPDGEYTIAASVVGSGKRYGAGQGSVSVSRDTKSKVKMTFLEIGLQATSVRGKVTGSAHKAGVAMAEIRMRGSGERAFSDGAGQYVLAGVEPGKRTILVTAQGYRLITKAITIAQAGELMTLNFGLARETAE